MNNYILEGKKPVPVNDIIQWAKWFESADRVVKTTQLANDVFISTIFLGLDHSFGDGEPILFETMIFNGEHDGYCERYATWEEAEEGHQQAIELIFN